MTYQTWLYQRRPTSYRTSFQHHGRPPTGTHRLLSRRHSRPTAARRCLRQRSRDPCASEIRPSRRSNTTLPTGLGNANPILYALANTDATRNAFHDITSGGNIVPCAPGSPDCPASAPYQFGYTAGAGYDQVTGLGSIDGANLVTALTSLAPTSTTLQIKELGATEGSPLQLTATVSSNASGNGTRPAR